jgi:methionyl-tRNA formyltransferase
MAGDAETGVCVMKMEAGLDTGPVAMTQKLPIEPDATAGELHDRLARLGADLVGSALDALERGVLTLQPQPEAGVTYAAKLDRAETRIDWRAPWRQVHDHIRGLSPFPGAWFEFPLDGKPVRVKVLRTTAAAGGGEPGALLDDRLTIACGKGSVRILQLQRAGGKAMGAEEFLRGTPLAPGTRLA